MLVSQDRAVQTRQSKNHSQHNSKNYLGRAYTFLAKRKQSESNAKTSGVPQVIQCTFIPGDG